MMPARAVAGLSAPRTNNRDMRVAARLAEAPAKRAERAGLSDLYFIARGREKSRCESLWLLTDISRFDASLSAEL